MGAAYDLLFLVVVALAAAVAQPATAETIKIRTPFPKWHIHVVNMLSKDMLAVHCKSKNDDLGVHNLSPGTEFNWEFRTNLLESTLFWCNLQKPNASVSFDVFWMEVRHLWLTYRCSNNLCMWIAKDDGIYLRNFPDGFDEFVHKWGP